MDLPEPVQPKKANNTTWIIIVVVVLILLCCILVAALGGLYYYLKQNGTLPSFLPGNVPLPAAIGTPTAIPEPLVVEPFDPTSSYYPTLQNLVTNWSGSSTPGLHNWSVTVSRNEPVMVFMGWCAASADILDQNYDHLAWYLAVDSQKMDVHDLYNWLEVRAAMACRTYVGLIRQWSGAEHTIVTTMTLDQKINDGWDDYPAGIYADNYHITVTP